jgi:hypothetical protein
MARGEVRLHARRLCCPGTETEHRAVVRADAVLKAVSVDWRATGAGLAVTAVGGLG